MTPPVTIAAIRNPRIVQQLRSIAVSALTRMYRPTENLFAFRLRRTREGDLLEGVSRRYTAISLIGLATEPEDVARGVLAGRTPQEVCGGLLDRVGGFEDVGEVALTFWAARILHQPKARLALKRLREMDPVHGQLPTVELAWCLSALTAAGNEVTDDDLTEGVAHRLLGSFSDGSALFPHWPVDAKSPFLRRHVSCFADLVYPVQCLSHYHMATGNKQAIEVARCCAEKMCDLQGPRGQWWWHYDVRSGRVIERYPVYAVHQDSMAPMALFALRQACGQDHTTAVERSLEWLGYASEIAGSLISGHADLIWRKVARHEPGKLVRSLQAAATRIHPALHAPGLGFLFRPGWVDYETRPYHMGWVLHAWPGKDDLARPMPDKSRAVPALGDLFSNSDLDRRHATPS